MLNVCVTVCNLCRTTNSPPANISGDDQIKVQPRFKSGSILLSYLLVSSGDIQSNIFMSCLWIAENPEIRIFTPASKVSLQREQIKSKGNHRTDTEMG